MFSFILNIPYTIIGLVVAIFSIPTRLSFKKYPCCFVFNVKKFWWTFGNMKKARAMTIGHVALLGPNVLEKDLEHELVHIKQHARMPLIFPIFYYIELFRKGYKNNKYEVEAYQKAGNIYMENGVAVRFSKSAGGIVLNSQSEVLVVRQNGGVWSLPKGHVEEGESEIDAAKREIYEESGIENIEFIKKLGEYSRYKIGLDGKDDTSNHKTMSMFLFRGPKGILKPIAPDSHEARWVKKENVSDLLTHPKDKKFFLSVQSKIVI